MSKSMLSNTRAVTEVLGFVLLFSVVLFSIVTVSVVGTNVLQDGRDTVVTSNMQEGFDRMAHSVDDLYQERAEQREVTLAMGKGSVSVGEPITIITEHHNDTHSPEIARTEIEPLIFSVGESKLIYAGTAIFRQGPDGSVAVVKSPDFKMSDDRAIFPLVGLNATGSSSVGGRASVRFVKTNATVTYGTSPPLPDVWEQRPGTDSDQFYMNIRTTNSERAEAWLQALKESADWDDIKQGPKNPGWVHAYHYPSEDATYMIHNVSVDYRLSS